MRISLAKRPGKRPSAEEMLRRDDAAHWRRRRARLHIGPWHYEDVTRQQGGRLMRSQVSAAWPSGDQRQRVQAPP